jgi:2-polyprenyl-6-methoxyphenol hydroxylase-like FAD-dependent oxidoreductase
MRTTTDTLPVLIVGGGPVGLALAAELGWQGVRCLLIEQGDGVVKTPKMNEVNTRSMEFCRRWGIAEQVLDTPFPLDWPKDVVFMTTLSGYELGRVKRPRNTHRPARSIGSIRSCSVSRAPSRRSRCAIAAASTPSSRPRAASLRP